VIVPALVVGWYACRGRILQIALARDGKTGAFPIKANRPLADEAGGGGDAPGGSGTHGRP